MQDGDGYEQLKQAVGLFYAGTDVSLQNYLFGVQKTSDAWQWSARMLQHESDPALRFFAASTLAVKISRDFETISDADDIQSLKSSLLQWLQQSSQLAYPAHNAPIASERVVTRKLAVAASNLSIKLHSSNNWPNWTLELMAILSAPSPQGLTCSKEAIFEVMTIVVEQSAGAYVYLQGKDKVSYDRSIYDAGAYVAKSIQDVLQSSPSPNLLNSAVKCCQSWVAASQIPPTDMTDLYPSLLLHLSTAEDISALCGCIEEWIMTSSMFFTDSKMNPLLDLLTGTWCSNRIQQAKDQEIVSEDLQALVKLFIAALEQACPSLVKQITTPRSISMFQNLLSILDFPGQFPVDEEISIQTFSTFGIIEESMAEEGMIGNDPDHQGQKVGKELFGALVTILLKKVMKPTTTFFQQHPKDTMDRFNNYRRDSKDVFLHCYYVLRGAMSKQMVSDILSIIGGQMDPDSSPALESRLFCLESLAEGIPHEDAEELLQLLSSETLTRFPPELAVHETTLCLIAELVEWIHNHPAALLPCLNVIVENLARLEHSQIAAKALSKLCDACRTDLTPYVGEFSSLVGQLADRIPAEVYVKLLSSVGSVLEALPEEEKPQAMVGLCEGPVTSLAQLAVQPPQLPPAEIIQMCQTYLECLRACASGFEPRTQDTLELEEYAPRDIFSNLPIVQRLRIRLLQALADCVRNYGSQAGIALSVAELCKAVTDTPDVSPLALDPVSVLEIIRMALHYEDVALWLSAASVMPFRITSRTNDPTRLAQFSNILHSICEGVLCRINGIEYLNANPDIAQSFMDFLCEVCRNAMAQLVALTSLTDRVFRLAVLALNMQERVSLQKTATFLVSIVQDSTSEAVHGQQLKQLILAEGSATVKILLQAIGSSAPRSSVPNLSELLHSFVKRYPSQSRLWISTAFAENDFPSVKVGIDDKERFLKQMLSARTLKKMRMVTDEYALKGRGLNQSVFASI